MVQHLVDYLDHRGLIRHWIQLYCFLHVTIDVFPCLMSTIQVIANEFDQHAVQFDQEPVPMNLDYLQPQLSLYDKIIKIRFCVCVFFFFHCSHNK